VRSNLKALARSELETLFSAMGEPSYRALQTYRRVHRHRARSIDELTELSLALRADLEERVDLPSARVEHRALAEGGTEKFILDVGIEESLEIEAVWIVGRHSRAARGRRTICVSCQAGCSLDCSFCATGRIPFAGNLEAWQIVEQVYTLERLRGARATNVVFMGMGEPFHNYDSVIAAARTLCDPDGAGLGQRRVTISTAGVLPAILRFTDEAQPYRLAISLNHSDPSRRQEIMPIDRRFPLTELLRAARRYTERSRRRVTFEYVMIDGVNMGAADAERLVAIGRSMPCKINLIPLNVVFDGFERPSSERASSFRRRLHQAGVEVFDRGSPGLEVAGACGMLALQREAPANGSGLA
jgi:23S rRNA (adenine2503-C2)-methyltransferase